MERYSQDLVKLKEDFGVNVYRTPDSVMQDQLKAWDIVIKRFTDSDPFFKRVIESQMAWAKRHGPNPIHRFPLL